MVITLKWGNKAVSKASALLFTNSAVMDDIARITIANNHYNINGDAKMSAFKALNIVNLKINALKSEQRRKSDAGEITNGSYGSGYQFALSDLKREIINEYLAKFLKADEGRCFHCRLPIEGKDLTIDHLVPLNKGGDDTIDNIVPSHGKCNWDKSNNLPNEEQITRAKQTQLKIEEII